MKANAIDRLAGRGRPPGAPVMTQRWEDLLFLHWPVDSVLPPGLDLDLFNGKAWITITPLHLTNVTLRSLPTAPGVSDFHELNVRTYVTSQGVPGIWFFSLDASRVLPTLGARIFYGLPYFKACMRFERNHPEFSFSATRTGNSGAKFSARWRVANRLRDPDVNSLAFFLVERYSLFTIAGNSVWQTRIYHHPYILEEAIVEESTSSMISALGIPEPMGEPVSHFCEALEVEVWPPVELLKH